MNPQPSAPLDAFLRGVDRRAEIRAGLLGATRHGRDDAFALRAATPGDRPALRDLARRDGVALPDGPLLLAEAAGRPIAVIGLENRRMAADPEWPTGRAIDPLQAAAAEHSPWPARLRRLRGALGGSGRRSPASGPAVR